MDAKPVDHGRGHETRDVSIRNLIAFGVALVILIVVGLLASEGVLRYFEVRQPLGPPASPFENVRTLPPAPRLQVAPVEDLARYRAAQDSALARAGRPLSSKRSIARSMGIRTTPAFWSTQP